RRGGGSPATARSRRSWWTTGGPAAGGSQIPDGDHEDEKGAGGAGPALRLAPKLRSAPGVDPGSPRGALGAGRGDRHRDHGPAVWQAPPQAERGLAAGEAAGPPMGRSPAAAWTHGLGPGDPRPTAPVGARRARPLSGST